MTGTVRAIDTGPRAARWNLAMTAALAALHSQGEGAPPGAVMVEGRKLCGTSGMFDGATLLFQGTVLIDLDLAAMAAALVETHADLAGRVVGLAELRGHRPSTEAVIAAITAGFVETFGAAFAPSDPTSDELALADRLLVEEFGREDFVNGLDEAAA